MKRNWKPEGYTSVAPYLISTDPEGVMKFADAVFGGKRLRRHEGPDGKVMHAEIGIGDSVVMIGYGGDDAGEPSHLHVYVEDVDAVFARAVKAGGKVVQSPEKKGDSDRRGGITDPVGTATWWIGTQVE
jgi:PhnB protein